MFDRQQCHGMETLKQSSDILIAALLRINDSLYWVLEKEITANGDSHQPTALC